MTEGPPPFTDIGAELTGVLGGQISWGDYDNDGDLDLAIAGRDTVSTDVSKIYRNDGGGVFTDIEAALTGVSGSVSWGDYDNDGDLDLALAGSYNDGSAHYVSSIYRNDGGGKLKKRCRIHPQNAWQSQRIGPSYESGPGGDAPGRNRHQWSNRC